MRNTLLLLLLVACASKTRPHLGWENEDLSIASVTGDSTSGAVTRGFVVTGTGFDNGLTAELLSGATRLGSLVVSEANAHSFLATGLPSVMAGMVNPASSTVFTLRLTTASGQAVTRELNILQGPAGPPGAPGVPGQAGAAGTSLTASNGLVISDTNLSLSGTFDGQFNVTGQGHFVNNANDTGICPPDCGSAAVVGDSANGAGVYGVAKSPSHAGVKGQNDLPSGVGVYAVSAQGTALRADAGVSGVALMVNGVAELGQARLHLNIYRCAYDYNGSPNNVNVSASSAIGKCTVGAGSNITVLSCHAGDIQLTGGCARNSAQLSTDVHLYSSFPITADAWKCVQDSTTNGPPAAYVNCLRQ